MTERGLPLADGASACPFVAFEDDRDERSSVPDHRHRCYAEPQPAPRAIAHQEAYCLSSAFPVCPIFQDWARREAARTRGASSAGAAGATAGASPDRLAADEHVDDGPHDGQPADAAKREHEDVAAAGLGMAAASAATIAGGSESGPAAEDDLFPAGAAAGDRTEPPSVDGDEPDADEPGRGAREWTDRGRADGSDLAQRNPPRDWSAPPPWLASSEAARSGAPDTPPFLGRTPEPGQGLAGSAADRLAGGPAEPSPDDEGDWVSSGSVNAARATPSRPSRPTAPMEPEDDELDDAAPRRAVRRPRAYDQHLGGPNGPDWERPRRQEAYPTIRTRVGLPSAPRLAVMAGLVAIAAVVLFFLPGVLNLGGTTAPPGSSAAPARSAAAASAPARPSVPAVPTPAVYTIKKGDTLSKVAKANGVTVEEILAANPTIKDPNKISEGQQIIIPSPSEAPPNEVGGSAEPSDLP